MDASTIFWITLLAVVFVGVILYIYGGKNRQIGGFLVALSIILAACKGCGCFGSSKEESKKQREDRPLDIRMSCSTYNVTKKVCEELHMEMYTKEGYWESVRMEE